MLCKFVKSDKYYKIILFVGIVTLIFGTIVFKNISAVGPNISMLKGMFQGAGGAFVVVAIVKLLQKKMTPAEKLKAKEIELKDERNVQILRVAHSISNITGIILFAVLSFVFVAMDYIVPAFMVIGAMYIQIIALLIGYKYYEKKM